jgi:hypothetical protein
MTEARSASPLTMTIYNPALLKKEDLIRGFVARQSLLARLLDDLRREVPGSTPQHQVIIGQRGLGKTTLLRRMAFAVEDDSALASTWLPLVFPEEQYNVGSLADFWLNCVDALSDSLDRSGDTASARALDSVVTKVPGNGPGRASRALSLLLDEADRLKRRVLLLVDNIDIVLDRLSVEEEWEFRRVLSEEGRLHFVGASSRALEAFYDYGRAFYDFFRIHELKGFDEEETFSTLCHLAEESGETELGKLLRTNPARIKALRVLTGGNPRTLVLLFRVLVQRPAGDVQHDIEQLLDDYTALYKARFEALAPQAQLVVDALAIHWDPLTAGDLADLLAPLKVNQISAQLNRLENVGVVEKTPWFGEKKNAFQIAERFFNIWYLMRSGRRVRRRLLWLVKFLEIWFDRVEPLQISGDCRIELGSVSCQGLSGVVGTLGLDRDPFEEAARTSLQAFELDPKRTEDLNRFLRACDRLADYPGAFPRVSEMLQRALDLAPNDSRLQFFNARILVLIDNWPEASRLLEQLAADESAAISGTFFRTAVKAGHLDETIAILERTGANDRWLPLYQALRSARAGTPDYLRTVAPEVRTVAMEILREIDPDLFPLTDA